MKDSSVNTELITKAGTGGFQSLVDYNISQNADSTWIITLDVGSQHLNQYGYAHGGVSLTLMDVAGGVALYASDKKINRMATISLSQNFINAMRPGLVTATGQIDRMGNSIGYCSMQLYQGSLEGELLATAQAAYRIFTNE